MNLRRFFLVLYAIAATQLLMTQVVFGMGGGSSSTGAEKAAQNPDYVKGKQYIEQENWQAAIQSLSKVVAKDKDDADAFNYLGYANRQLGNLEIAFEYYHKALDINPRHKGANEYVGEAYLQVGNLIKAEEHLSRLDNICTFGCSEYTMLKRAVSNYKKSNSG
ncbi:MAG: tetratricopeptide repeat protein [Sneathiella sp.]|nr:tetratricopeptide repeat protein [Sneathiella sp.]